MLYFIYIMQYSVYTLQKIYVCVYIYIYIKENSDSFTLYDDFTEWGPNCEQETCLWLSEALITR